MNTEKIIEAWLRVDKIPSDYSARDIATLALKEIKKLKQALPEKK